MLVETKTKFTFPVIRDVNEIALVRTYLYPNCVVQRTESVWLFKGVFSCEVSYMFQVSILSNILLFTKMVHRLTIFFASLQICSSRVGDVAFRGHIIASRWRIQMCQCTHRKVVLIVLKVHVHNKVINNELAIWVWISTAFKLSVFASE